MRLLPILLLLSGVAYAQDDCRGNRNCNDYGGVDGVPSVTTSVSVDSPVDVNSSISNSSRAYGLGLGDVDIAQCYRSWQVLIYQDSKPNWFCLADSLDAKGLHKAAAELRCSVKSYRQKLGDKCLALSTASSPAQPMADTHLDEEQELHLEQMVLVEELRAKIAAMEAALNKPAPRPVVRREVVEKGGLTAEQKAQLREVVK